MLNVGSCFYSTFSLSEFFYALYRAKKVVSDSPGLVDFEAGLVNPVLNLSEGQVVFWGGKFKIQKNCNSVLLMKTFFGLL